MASVTTAIFSHASRNTSVQGLNGEPLTYPVPLFVRNTFIDHDIRSPSLDGFFQQRLVASCPTSLVSEPDDSVSAPAPLPLQRVKTAPSQVIRRGATPDFRSTVQVADDDDDSECSTADTAEEGLLRIVVPATRPMMSTQLNSAAAPWTGFVTVLRLQEAVFPPLAALLPNIPSSAGAWPQDNWGPVLGSASRFQVPIQQVSSSLGTEVLPSLGSVEHQSGDCKPCAFLHSKGCVSGVNCEFCHLCEPGEKKRRQKEKRAFFSSVRQIRQLVGGVAR